MGLLPIWSLKISLNYLEIMKYFDLLKFRKVQIMWFLVKNNASVLTSVIISVFSL